MSKHHLDSKINNQSNNNSIVKNTSHSYQTILATDIPLTYSESDLYSIFSRYGSVNKIQKLSNLSCCLIEFSDSNTSIALIQMSKYNSFYIGAHKIKLEYTSQIINPIENKTTDNSTNILSINITNVKYPITVDIIKQICLKFGKLQKIFIGKKTPENIVESLIEFEKISEAKAAKEALHGEDIYSGCCSLDVKYSKMSTVPVFKNDDESWDFTKSQIKPGILKSPLITASAMSTVTVAAAAVANGIINNSNNNNINSNSIINNNNNANLFPGSTAPIYPTIYNYPPPLYNPFPCRQPPFDPNVLMLKKFSNSSSKSKKQKLEINKDAFVVEVGVVFIVYNLSFHMCVDHLFNLFCLYGNVHKIRFLPGQPGTAMVQMGSRTSVDLCMRHFGGRSVFGQEMRLVRCSKPEIFFFNRHHRNNNNHNNSNNNNISHQQMKNGGMSEFLPNGTPAFKDFSTDPNNRFLNDHAIASNKILEPNRTLHFFNAPHAFVEADLSSMLQQSGAPRPLHIIIFGSGNNNNNNNSNGHSNTTNSTNTNNGNNSNTNTKSESSRKCIGLFEFPRLEDALAALALLNHKPIIIPDTNQVFHMKLTFSAREPKGSVSQHSMKRPAATLTTTIAPTTTTEPTETSAPATSTSSPPHHTDPPTAISTSSASPPPPLSPAPLPIPTETTPESPTNTAKKSKPTEGEEPSQE